MPSFRFSEFLRRRLAWNKFSIPLSSFYSTIASAGQRVRIRRFPFGAPATASCCMGGCWASSNAPKGKRRIRTLSRDPALFPRAIARRYSAPGRKLAWNKIPIRVFLTLWNKRKHRAASSHTALPFRRTSHRILLYGRGWDELQRAEREAPYTNSFPRPGVVPSTSAPGAPGWELSWKNSPRSGSELACGASLSAHQPRHPAVREGVGRAPTRRKGSPACQLFPGVRRCSPRFSAPL